MSEFVGQPSDEDMRAYLEGEHGPPSPEVVQIIHDELAEAVAKSDALHERISDRACSCGASYSWAWFTHDQWWADHKRRTSR